MPSVLFPHTLSLLLWVTAAFSPSTIEFSPWGQNRGVWQFLSSHLPKFAIQEEKSPASRILEKDSDWPSCHAPASWCKLHDQGEGELWSTAPTGATYRAVGRGMACGEKAVPPEEDGLLRRYRICRALQRTERRHKTGKICPSLLSVLCFSHPQQSPNVSPAVHPHPKVRNTLLLPGSTFSPSPIPLLKMHLLLDMLLMGFSCCEMTGATQTK